VESSLLLPRVSKLHPELVHERTFEWNQAHCLPPTEGPAW